MGCLVFLADLIALNGCESYKFDIHSHISYNMPLATLSDKGLCEWTRLAYKVGFVLDFAFQYYMAEVGQEYYSMVAQNPAYLVKFDPDAYEPTVPTKLIGEPANYYIDREAEKEYLGIKSEILGNGRNPAYGTQ